MIKHIFKLIWNKKGSNSLILLEIFLSFIVLFFTVGYMIYNIGNLKKPLGFETTDRWVIRLDGAIPEKDSTERTAILQSLKQNLEDNAHIDQVSFLENIIYFQNNNWIDQYKTVSGVVIQSHIMPVDINTKATVDIKIKEGRWFDENDLNSNYQAVVVNQQFVDEAFPGGTVIDTIFNDNIKVVGVTDEIRYVGRFSDNNPTVYMLNDYLENDNHILLKMKPNTPASVEEEIWNLVNKTSKTSGSVITTMDKMEESNSRNTWVILVFLLTICGFLCINVAMGLFGVLSYNINKRRGEIGLRQALGATGFDVTKQFILEMLILTSIAVGLGVFFGVQIPLLDLTEYDDGIFYQSLVYSSFIIFGLVFLCAFFPSIQASRVRPAEALHED